MALPQPPTKAAVLTWTWIGAGGVRQAARLRTAVSVIDGAVAEVPVRVWPVRETLAAAADAMHAIQRAASTGAGAQDLFVRIQTAAEAHATAALNAHAALQAYEQQRQVRACCVAAPLQDSPGPHMRLARTDTQAVSTTCASSVEARSDAPSTAATQHLNPNSVSSSDWKNVIRAAQLAFVTTTMSGGYRA